ncbi:MAG: sulfite exporter TauE/SafE family protein [Thermodesulfovibrionia bacterium]|nr:sulfite exporter TauE/SafE family protein [Thermodesulfovibrionia bacterium]
MQSVTFRFSKVFLTLMIFLIIILGAADVFAVHPSTPLETPQEHVWWFWPLILLVLSFVLGIFAVLAGVGGGVLYVPIVSGFLPFHLDFVRGAGLIVALAGALAAGPGLLRRAMADLRLAIPLGLIASTCAIIGAMIGLALPTNIVQTLLGATILGIVVIMIKAKKSEFPSVPKPDALSQSLKIMGVYHEPTIDKDVSWQVHRTPLALFLFVIIGIMAGMFGLGAGWANVPVLNLLMGAPIKISVATSKFLLSITDTSAAWIYMNNGAVLPLMVVPSVIGIMLGSFVGVKILTKTKPAIIRILVIVVLSVAGLKALLKGLGIG